jgi:hypothetical protein
VKCGGNEDKFENSKAAWALFSCQVGQFRRMGENNSRKSKQDNTKKSNQLQRQARGEKEK